MRFNVPEDKPNRPSEPEIGNLYRGHGGGTKYWVLVAMSPGGGTHCLLGLNIDGHVVSSGRYGSHVMRNRECIGKVKTEIELDVELFDG